MLLSDRDLLTEIETGSLALDPFDVTLIQPSGIDVRLEASPRRAGWGC